MLFAFVFCTTFVNVVCRSFFHAEHQFDIRIKIFRNGGNNTECDRNPVVMKVNTVIGMFYDLRNEFLSREKLLWLYY